MEKIVNITIDGDSYLKFKKAYEETKAKKLAIDFGNESFFSYGWTFYTKDEAIVKMAKEFEFIEFKHLEQYKSRVSNLESQIDELKAELLSLRNATQ